jgi:uncharacterized protein (TIGR02996 family)
VTDDEAFLRAIVDAPGDDAPRLVYADWLDERNDPRGGYVRAELDWARTRAAAGVRPLQTAATGLDPVWVARITRPPGGICTDRLALTGRGPRLKPALLGDVESRYDLQLPAEYRAFLLNHNGGRLNFPVRERWWRVPARVTLWFHRLLRSWRLPPYRGRVAAFRRPPTDLRTMIHVYRFDYARMVDDLSEDQGWRANFLPIAQAEEPEVWDVFLGLSGPRRGRVYEFDYLYGPYLEGMTKLDPSLGRFLHRCERRAGSR